MAGICLRDVIILKPNYRYRHPLCCGITVYCLSVLILLILLFLPLLLSASSTVTVDFVGVAAITVGTHMHDGNNDEGQTSICPNLDRRLRSRLSTREMTAAGSLLRSILIFGIALVHIRSANSKSSNLSELQTTV